VHVDTAFIKDMYFSFISCPTATSSRNNLDFTAKKVLSDGTDGMTTKERLNDCQHGVYDDVHGGILQPLSMNLLQVPA